MDQFSYRIALRKIQQNINGLHYVQLDILRRYRLKKIKLISLDVSAGTKGQKATLELDVSGKVSKTQQSGDGPVDSIFKCIKEIFPHDVNLQLYQVHAVTEGTDAQATVSVRIEEKGKISVGQAADTDTLVASAKAYINALNKLILKRKRTAPTDDEYSAAV